MPEKEPAQPSFLERLFSPQTPPSEVKGLVRPRNASTIRASEIGAFLYCRRAWWYQRQGHQPQNQAELLHGSRIHQAHGRTVLRANLLRTLGYLLLLIALVLLAVHLTGQMV
jgi:hypothetical protein